MQLRQSMAYAVWFTINLIAITPATIRAHDHDHGGALRGAVFPRLSPQGDSVVFSHQGSIWRIPRTGGAMQQLTDGAGFDVEPTWSPDGQRIAFIRGRSSFSGYLQVVQSLNGEPVAIPGEVIAKDRLFFDRAGARLLGCFHRGDSRFGLCWFDLASGQLGPQLRADRWGQRYALSPRGDRIAIATSRDVRGEQGGNQGPQCDIWLMPSSGGEPQKLVQFPGRVYELSWQADDTALYVVSNVGGVHNDLWRVPLSDPLSGARKLTFGQADEDAPSSNRDGRWLVFTDNRGGPTALVVRDLETGMDRWVTVSQRRFRLPTGTLELQITDKPTADAVTARVSIQQVGGKFYAPPAALYRMLRSDVHFYCTGAARFDVPVGRYAINVSRGAEYPVVRRQVEVVAAAETTVQVELQRWIDQRSRGWYSGESHIHANYGYGQWYNSPTTMLAQCAGEDLIVCNFMVANSEADGVFDREYFRGAPDPRSTKDTVLYWNEEFRSTIWGHMTLLNLKQLVEPIFTGFAHTTHPHDHLTNADIADLTHDQSGHVNYTHPAHNVKDPYLSAYSAKALPIDVALGKVDSIDVMGSNHVATMPLWYRLLNCGFRIPASAGTDCFLNRIRSRLPGQDRVYVQVEGDFSYQRWIDQLRAGRTFVTNGPMFEFTVDGMPPGSSIELEHPGEVRVRGRVVAQYPLERVEVVANGDVVAAHDVAADRREATVDTMIQVPHSGWVALRAAGPPHPDQPSGSVFGHTSAVYLTVRDKPQRAREDADYFVTWTDRLWQDVRKRNRIVSRHQVHVESQIAEAREVFNKLRATE